LAAAKNDARHGLFRLSLFLAKYFRLGRPQLDLSRWAGSPPNLFMHNRWLFSIHRTAKDRRVKYSILL
jgi:hypothetical protein